jgi:hypothetical protein
LQENLEDMSKLQQELMQKSGDISRSFASTSKLQQQCKNNDEKFNLIRKENEVLNAKLLSEKKI